MKKLTTKIIAVTSLLLLLNFITYSQQEINFASGDVTLSGTLLLPKGAGPFPVVIFIHGSGAEERSNSRLRAKEFTRNGIAAFIYDKRGAGSSGGDKNFPQYFSFDTLAMDVNAAVDELMKRADIKKDAIGFVAASQGGWVAPLAASLNKNIAFMIIISGSVSTVGEDNLFERNARLKNEGFSDSEIKEAEAMHIVDQEVSRSGKRFDEFVQLWNQYKTAKWFKRVYIGEEPNPVGSKFRQWYKRVVDFEPVAYLQQLSIPILWLYGDAEIDRFCPVDVSVSRLNQLKASGKKYEIILNPGADHSLQKKSRDLAIEQPTFDWLKSINVIQ